MSEHKGPLDIDLSFMMMPHTQALIAINTVDTVKTKVAAVMSVISGFKGCTVITNLKQINIVFQHNKNAVYFTASTHEIEKIKKEHPDAIFIDLTPAQTRKGFLNSNPANTISAFPKAMWYYGIDVGDHRSKDSKSSTPQSTKKCLLCRILNRNTDKPEHILFEYDFGYVVPGTGAFDLNSGYIMYVPKRHVMSFANMNELEWNEFKMVHKALRELLSLVYNRPVFSFECSSGKTGAGKHETSIVHAHFHFMCTEMPVLEEITKSGITPALINEDDLVNYNEYPYMLYVDQEYNWYIEGDPDAYFPRQHPRQVIANWMGDYAHYNWRKFPYRERMDVIADTIRSYCKDHFNELPEIIRDHVRFED